MSEEIRPCPFCGHSASLDENGFVSCDGIECQARGPFRAYDNLSISAWNRRTDDARVERMEKVVSAAREVVAHPRKWAILKDALATVEQGGTEARPCHICGVGHVFGIACPEPKGGTGKEEGNG